MSSISVDVLINIGHFLDNAESAFHLRATCKSLWPIPIRALLKPETMLLFFKEYSELRSRMWGPDHCKYGTHYLAFVDVDDGDVDIDFLQGLYGIIRQEHSHIIYRACKLGLFARAPDYVLSLGDLIYKSPRRTFAFRQLTSVLRRTPVGSPDIVQEFKDALKAKRRIWPDCHSDCRCRPYKPRGKYALNYFIEELCTQLNGHNKHMMAERARLGINDTSEM